MQVTKLRLGVTLLLAACLTFAVTACGGGGSDSTGSSSAETPVESTSTESNNAAETEPGEQATGKPIVIGDITDASVDSTQSVVPAAQDAAADYINSHGGINGRPIEMMHCDPKGDPAAANACINEFAQANVLAITGDSLIMGACCVTTVEKAEIPFFTLPVLPAELESEWGVLIGGGEQTNSYVKAKWALEGGTKKISVLTLDLPTTHYSAELKEKLIGDQAEVDTVYYKFGLADLTAPINQVVQFGPEKVILTTSTPDELKAIPIFQQNGITAEEMITGQQSLDYANFLEPLGDAAEGMYFTNSFASFSDTSNEDVALYLKIMEEHNAPAEAGYAQWAFADMMLIWEGAKELKDPTAVELHEFFKSAGPMPIFMAEGDLIPLSETVKGYPALRNFEENLTQWDAANEELKTIKSFDTKPVMTLE